MTQLSRPMQLALGAALLFAALWFVVLKPKNAAEPAAATPATVTATATATPRPVEAGGAAASTGLGKAVESANNAAATSNAKTAADEAATGDQTASAAASTTPASTTPASAASAAAPAATTPAKTAKTPAQIAKAKKAAAAKKAESQKSRAQRHADHVTALVAKDLTAGRAVVVLVSSQHGSEDKIVRTRVRHDIDRRHGKVAVYLVPASKVGLYEGLLGSLNIGQTPSTIVIAPDNTAKVLGGLVSVARIDRLTSAAVLVTPAKTK